MDFAEKHPNYKNKLVVLLMHDTQAKTFADLDPKLEELSSNVWNGRKLPFPILLDSSGASLKAWGVMDFPSAFLIDPEGKIVASGHPLSLEEKLEEIVKGK